MRWAKNEVDCALSESLWTALPKLRETFVETKKFNFVFENFKSRIVVLFKV